MKINQYFKEEYLTCGRTRDNFIFENCPLEVIEVAQILLGERANEVKPCNIDITAEEEMRVENTLSQCMNEYQKNAISRDFVTALIIEQMLSGEDVQEYDLEMLENGINAILEGDFEQAKRFHLDCPMPSDIVSVMQDVGKIEINFFLIGSKNVYLQRAINNLISSREPYSVKIFTTNKRLPSYQDQAGNRIECPHDFMTKNILNYIQSEDEIEAE